MRAPLATSRIYPSNSRGRSYQISPKGGQKISAQTRGRGEGVCLKCLKKFTTLLERGGGST
jgi:hypothetical protein